MTSELSIIIPAYNEAENIEAAIEAVAATVGPHVDQFEIVVVDDGSRDETVEKVRALTVPFTLRLVRLSRNFGKEQAMMAGLEYANGELVMIIDADGQESLEKIPLMLDLVRGNYDVAFAVRSGRKDEGLVKRGLTRAFYYLLSVGSEVPVQANARDFRIMRRCVVEAVLSLPERNRFMKGLFNWVGFRSIAVPIEVKKRDAGTSKFRLVSLIRLSLTALTSFTVWPLRIWIAIGATISLVSLAYGAWIVVKTLLWGVDTPGFATIAVAIMFLGGIQLLSVGVLGEYISRIYVEAKGRPGYIVADVEGNDKSVEKLSFPCA